MKILEGTILLFDETYRQVSRFQYPNVPVIRVNTTNAKTSGGINRLKMIFNGTELNRDDEDYFLAYPAKGGIKFRITTIGSISEGIPVNQEAKISFYNLINPEQDILDLNFMIGFSMDDYSNTQGYSLISELDTT